MNASYARRRRSYALAEAGVEVTKPKGIIIWY